MSALFIAATYNFKVLQTELGQLKTFLEGTSDYINKEWDLEILQAKQHNCIFFTLTDSTTLTTFCYGQHVAQNILFYMQIEGFALIHNAEPK